MTTEMGFAQNLIYIRQHYNITQEALAEQLGVSRQTVSKWEAGINFPETDKLLLICDLYHTNLDDLMRGSVRVANANDTERYDKHMNSFCRGIVAGIVFILSSSAVYTLLGGLGVGERIALAVLFAFIVIGMLSLVVSGMTHVEFKRKNPDLDPSYPAEVLDRFGKRFIVLISGGIASVLIGIIVYLALSPEGDGPGLLFGTLPAEPVALTVLLAIIALGVGVLVYAGMQKSKYDMSEFASVPTASLAATAAGAAPSQQPSAEALKRSHITGAVCGALMLTAIIVYFVLGNVVGFAHGWVVFPVAIMLCGIVTLITNAFNKSGEELLAEAKKENPWMRSPKPQQAGESAVDKTED